MRRRSLPLRAVLPLALLLPFLVAAESGITPPASPVADTSLAGQADAGALCDTLDDLHCLLPFPSDRFTVADARTTTGRRVQLEQASVPRNTAGKPIDTTEWNRQDGWSPGQALLTHVPGLDLDATWQDGDDHITEIGRELAADSPMVVVNTRTGERHPFWSELDTHPDTTDDHRLLIIRPARNWEEGTRYVVGLRNMRDADGDLLPAGETFAAYRDGTSPLVPDPTFESRRPAMEATFADLAAAGVARDDLYLAWDFTVASSQNIAGRVLHIRDQSLAALGDSVLTDGVPQGAAPAFEITAVEDHLAADGSRAGKGRTVHGSVTVPNYLTPPQDETRIDAFGVAQQVPGSRFNYADPTGYTDPTALPTVNPAAPTTEAPFVCTIPGSAFPGEDGYAGPSRVSLYGHGLLGGRGESEGSSANALRLAHGYTHCALDWEGMSFEDVANVATILADVSSFPTLADRSQQGFLNWIVFSRAIVHPEGLGADPAFRDGGTPLLDGSTLVYDGNSQGGIMGGALLALSVDLTRGTLGVTGMNYSTLLNRSHDWEGALLDPASPGIPSYSSALYASYPSKVEQQLIFGLIQMLWDRAEANGYAAHMTHDPYPNTPAHQVLLHIGYGDLQVTNVSAEVEARTVGAHLLGASVPARHWAWSSDEGSPHDAGLPGFPKQGFVDGGSALVYWDSGHPTPFNGNVPPNDAYGDPHEHPRRDPLAALQKAIFYDSGRIVDVFHPRTFDGRFSGTPYRTCRYPVTSGGQPNPELGDDLSYGTRDAYCPSY